MRSFEPQKCEYLISAKPHFGTAFAALVYMITTKISTPDHSEFSHFGREGRYYR